MRRRHFPRSEPPPVSRLRVPDVARDKGVKLSRAQKRALKAGQLDLLCVCPVERMGAAADPEGF